MYKVDKLLKMMYYEPSGEKSMYPFLAFSREEYISLIERSIRLVAEAIKDAASLSKPDYSKAVMETKDLIMKKAVFKKGSDCLEIRVAGVADASAVGKVHSEAWKSAYRGVFPDRYINSDTASKRTDEFLDSIKDDKYTYYLLQESNQTAGIVKTHAEENSLEIESFYILSEYRGKGLGSQFIDFIKNSVKPECIFLWCLEDNSKARHFYENNGFVMTGDSRMINRGTELKQIRYNLLRQIGIW